MVVPPFAKLMISRLDPGRADPVSCCAVVASSVIIKLFNMGVSMGLGCLFQIAVAAVAAAAGMGYCSFWWTLIPLFVAASLSVSNGPGFDLVMRANQEGRLGTLPMLIMAHMLPLAAIAGVIYWGVTTFS